MPKQSSAVLLHAATAGVLPVGSPARPKAREVVTGAVLDAFGRAGNEQRALRAHAAVVGREMQRRVPAARRRFGTAPAQPAAAVAWWSSAR